MTIVLGSRTLYPGRIFMAESPNLQTRISARVVTASNQPDIRATLISPLFAVTTLGAVPDDRMVPILQSPAWSPQGVSATVEGRDLDRGFVLLRLASAPTDVPEGLLNSVDPPVGSRWESISGSGTVSAVMTERGQRYLRLSSGTLSDPVPAGAPILVGGRLVGISNSSLPDGLLAIPVSSMVQSSAVPAIRDVLPLDEAAFLARLSPSSLTALGRARSMIASTHQSHIHMEHLIVALHQKEDGPAERLFGAANIDSAELRKVLATAVEIHLPAPGVIEPATLTSLPSVSQHVRAAFVGARNIANAQKSDQIQSRHLLYGALSVEECTLIQALTARGVRKENIPFDDLRAHARALAIAGFKSDQADGEDQLDIEKEVEALCMVLAARDIEPPISLGLFGDWGSGKSFFMKKMEDWFKRLKAQNQIGSPYCSNIVQLKFNAWHYSDTNLWASLTAAILQGLAQALSDKDDPDSQYARAGLEAKKEVAQTKLTQAEREKIAAEADVRASEQRLQQLDTTVPPQYVVREAFRAAIKQPQLANQIQDAAKELGVPQAEAAAENLKNELLQVKSIWDTFALMLRSANRRNLWLLCAAVVLLVSIGVPVLFWAKSKGLGARIASATTVLVASAALIERVVTPLLRAKKLVDQVRQSAQEAIDKEQQAKKKKAEEDHQKLVANAASARQKVETASAAISLIDQDLDRLRPDRQMTDFIRQRFQSSDYTSQLGVISRARKDFEQLTTLLAQVRKLSEDELRSGAQQELLLPRIDRIILYVDDLDRCPEEKVVDVLQAVHLLLAFKLFVVVVGVDPRWLLHSLTQHSSAFRDAASASEWKSTPMNYLEKIFQIPFTLRPMEKQGFGKLLDSLTVTPARQETKQAVAVKPTEEEMQQPAVVGAGAKPASEEVSAVRTAAAVSAPPLVAGEKNIQMDPAALRLEDWERECMKKLNELVPSPRAAKRFVNVYRLLRSTVTDDQWSSYIGDANRGLHRPVLLLLAILTGYPAEATEILRALIEGSASSSFWALIDDVEKRSNGKAPAEDVERRRELFVRLRGLRTLVPENQQSIELVEYARQVARYSFQSGRILLTHVNAGSSAASAS
jgi:KAP family P-loop domain/Clp amino terminal domain, pathogenicity island component